MIPALRRVLIWTVTVGGVSFAVGFFGYTATPLELMARWGLVPVAGRQALRIAAGVGGVILLITGITGLPQGAGRPAAASIVVAGALLWYAAVGQIPGWFTR